MTMPRVRSLFKSRKSGKESPLSFSEASAETPTKLSQKKPDPLTPPLTPNEFDDGPEHADAEDLGTLSQVIEVHNSFGDGKPRPISRSGGSRLRKNGKRMGFGSEVKSQNGIPIITSDGADHFSPSVVNGKNAVSGVYVKPEAPRPKVRPTAKSSAFFGPVRYDWMDIETAAAVKVQAAFRRNKVLRELDEKGISTAGMRNRRRRRNAKQRMAKSEDVPFPFSLCGVGFLFGDGTLEDDRVTESLEKKKRDEIKREKETLDERKRRFRMRKKSSQQLEEGIEVVESFDGPRPEEVLS